MLAKNKTLQTLAIQLLKKLEIKTFFILAFLQTAKITQSINKKANKSRASKSQGPL